MLLLLLLVVVLLLLLLRRAVGRPVGRPVSVVPVVVGRLLRGPGQRVRAGRPVVVVLRGGRRRRTAVHVPAASVYRPRGALRRPVQRSRLGVVVAAVAVV